MNSLISLACSACQISGSPQEFPHNESGVDKQDEGFVQTFKVDTNNLANFEHVFVSVWAVNQVSKSIYLSERTMQSILYEEFDTNCSRLK
jgi:hypothetical protein